MRKIIAYLYAYENDARKRREHSDISLCVWFPLVIR